MPSAGHAMQKSSSKNIACDFVLALVQMVKLVVDSLMILELYVMSEMFAGSC